MAQPATDSNAPCRLATVDFIKETLVALPAAPSADEFGRLKAERVRAAERRVADEREAARLAKAKFEELKAQQASGTDKSGGQFNGAGSLHVKSAANSSNS